MSSSRSDDEHRAGHEVLRQGRRELELLRMTPDLWYDQMAAICIGVGQGLAVVWHA